MGAKSKEKTSRQPDTTSQSGRHTKVDTERERERGRGRGREIERERAAHHQSDWETHDCCIGRQMKWRQPEEGHTTSETGRRTPKARVRRHLIHRLAFYLGILQDLRKAPQKNLGS